MSDWNDRIIAEFRENNGKVGGPFEGAHLLLLTTTGAKSGEPRTSPMMYFPESDGSRTVVASKAGAPTNPAWYHNLLANPRVHVEASVDGGIEEYDAVATPIPEPRRSERYAEIGITNPGFAEYQEKTTRLIPLVSIAR